MILGASAPFSPIDTPSIAWLAIAPVIALAAAGILVVMARALLRGRPAAGAVATGLAILGIGAAGGLLAWQWFHVRDHGPISTMTDMVRTDPFAVYLGILVVAATAAAVFLSITYLRTEGLEGPEYLALVLLSAAGMLAMTSANDLVVVFVALEVLSIPLYVLAAFDRRRLGSQEAGIKYFVLGAFASALLLYGIALVYGATGTTSLTGIAEFLTARRVFEDGTLLAGIVLLIVGLGFKVSSAPFHQWTPDVYQGAPSPVTAFMSSATKVAGFAAFLRVFLVAFPVYRSDWRPVIMALAVASLVVGTFAAVVQTDLKRMLAYSSISHAGYILVAFAAAGTDDVQAASRGLQAALLYLLTYTFMTIGAFGVVTVVGRRTHDGRHGLSQYRGLARREPVLAGFLTFFLLAQAGVPFTGGFVAKLQVFASAVDAQEYWLAIVAVLSTVVAAFFYLRVTVVLFGADDVAGAHDEAGSDEAASRSPRSRRWIDVPAGAVLVVSVVLVVWSGVFPGFFLDFARDAGSLLALP